jgi:hypothetical protein
MPNNKINAMTEILDNDELEVLNDAMRLGKVRPFGRMRQAARRLCKRRLMDELVHFYFMATEQGKELFNETKGKKK